MHFLSKWIPVSIVMISIFLLSSVPGQTVQAVGLGDDSIHITGHFIMFFLLTLAVYRATKSIPLAIFITVIYAFTDEFHQRYTPGRSSSLKDILTDSLAAVSAGVLIWKFYPKIPAKLRILLEK